jgi:hypothetical protein
MRQQSAAAAQSAPPSATSSAQLIDLPDTLTQNTTGCSVNCLEQVTNHQDRLRISPILDSAVIQLQENVLPRSKQQCSNAGCSHQKYPQLCYQIDLQRNASAVNSGGSKRAPFRDRFCPTHQLSHKTQHAAILTPGNSLRTITAACDYRQSLIRQ